MDDFDEGKDFFVFRDTTFAELNYGTLLKFAEAPAIQALSISSNSVHAVELSIDKGIFLCNYGFRAAVSYTHLDVYKRQFTFCML